MVAAAVSAKYVFDLQPGDVYWCTADCGWVVGPVFPQFQNGTVASVVRIWRSEHKARECGHAAQVMHAFATS